MTIADAEALTAKLFAAFPFPQQDLTAAVYVEQIAMLPSRDFALEAVDDLIQTAERLPPIAAVRDAYVAVRARTPQAGLPMPELSAEETAANVRRMRALASTIGNDMSLEERQAAVDAA